MKKLKLSIVEVMGKAGTSVFSSSRYVTMSLCFADTVDIFIVLLVVESSTTIGLLSITTGVGDSAFISLYGGIHVVIGLGNSLTSQLSSDVSC